jgi:hypothetical protein
MENFVFIESVLFYSHSEVYEAVSTGAPVRVRTARNVGTNRPFIRSRRQDYRLRVIIREIC